MFNSYEEQFVTEIQEIQEEQITIRFDFPKNQGAPWTRTLILRQLGFGVVAIIGMNPDEAQVGDIVVELMHNGFYMKAQVWVKM